MHYRMFSSSLVMDASTIIAVMTKMSSDVAKYPLRGKVFPLLRNTVVNESVT